MKRIKIVYDDALLTAFVAGSCVGFLIGILFMGIVKVVFW